MSVSDEENGSPLTERMRQALYTFLAFLDLFLIPLFGFRNNGLSLAETASKSLNSLFSLKERVSPRLLGLKVRIKVKSSLKLFLTFDYYQEWGSKLREDLK